MKRITYVLIAVGLLVATPAMAQTVATDTTLAANVTATATTLSLASGTSITVGNFLYIDEEQLLIRAVNDVTITVQRGMNGTAARAHDNAEVVIEGPADHFHTNPPDFGADCTRGEAQATFLPWIDVRSGLVWGCREGETNWSATTTQVVTFNSRPTSF